MMEFRIVWLANPKDMYETEWIHELISLMPEGLKYEHIYHPDRTHVFHNAIIIFNHAEHAVPYDDYFQLYEDSKIPFIAVQLSDEILGVSYKFIEYSMCYHVFRNYIHPLFIHNRKVSTFGLGYKSGYRMIPRRNQASYAYKWCFIGTAHTPERLRVFEPILSIAPHKFVAGTKFGEGVSLEEYKRVMELSLVALCPIGQCNLDTFRFYEALEANTIPMVLGHTPVQRYHPSYWHFMFPWEEDLPFLIIDSWDKAHEAMQKLMTESLTELEERKKKLQVFWSHAKKKWATDFYAKIMGLISQA